MTEPTGTSTPAPRRTFENATTTRSGGVTSGSDALPLPPALPRLSATPEHGSPHEVAQARRPHALLVFLILEHGAEGHIDRSLVEPLHAEHGDGRCPVDGLGYPRRLVEAHRAQRL